MEPQYLSREAFDLWRIGHDDKINRILLLQEMQPAKDVVIADRLARVEERVSRIQKISLSVSALLAALAALIGVR